MEFRGGDAGVRNDDWRDAVLHGRDLNLSVDKWLL
jgi:hypothetical protein